MSQTVKISAQQAIELEDKCFLMIDVILDYKKEIACLPQSYNFK